MEFKVGKPIVMLRDFFGSHEGQTPVQFAGEVKRLSPEDRAEIEQMVATEIHSEGDESKIKRYGLEVESA